jgi:hypothetical protein
MQYRPEIAPRPHSAAAAESARLAVGINARRASGGGDWSRNDMMRIIRGALAFLVLIASQVLVSVVANQVPTAQAQEEVDLLLVLASDVSRSVDHPKFLLQRDGYAAAMSNPQVIDAIKSGPNGKIAVNFLEWSGYGAQKVVVDWMIIDSPASGRRMGDLIIEAPRSFADRTSIAGAIDFSLAQLERAPYAGGRRTIDVSGDGTNNAGRDIRLARDEAVAKGVTINGLVILSDRSVPWNAEHTNPPGGLEKYYRDNVMGGPGSFVMVAEDFQSFGKAVIRKMIAEIATLKVGPRIIMR